MEILLILGSITLALAPSPLHPTAVPKCSPLPKSLGRFSTQGSNIYCSPGEAPRIQHISLQPSCFPGSSCPTLRMRCVSHPPSRPSRQSCLPCSRASQRNCQNQRALLAAKFELPSGKPNKTMCSSPDVLTKSMMMLRFPLRTLPSRGITSGEKYHFKDIPIKQNGILTSLEPKPGGRF